MYLDSVIPFTLLFFLLCLVSTMCIMNNLVESDAHCIALLMWKLCHGESLYSMIYHKGQCSSKGHLVIMGKGINLHINGELLL